MTEALENTNKTETTLPSVLFVDDETQILDALRRAFRKASFTVMVANGGEEALELVASRDFDVIVSDMRMPEMNGAEFLTAAAAFKPTCKRILLTGYSDNDSTVIAINKGRIHAYLEKPIKTDELKEKIDTLIVQKREEDRERLIAEHNVEYNQTLKDKIVNLKEDKRWAEQELEQTTSFLNLAQEETKENFSMTIKILSLLMDKRLDTDITEKITRDALLLADTLDLDLGMKEEIKNAALLHNLGKIYFPDRILTTPYPYLTVADKKLYDKHVLNAEEILMPLNGMSHVAKIIRHQSEDFNGKGKPDALKTQDIPLSSRLLRVVIDFYNPIGHEVEQSVLERLACMEEKKGEAYDPDLLELFSSLKKSEKAEEFGCELTVDELTPGMVNNRDLLSASGMLMLSKGTVLTGPIIQSLQMYEQNTQLKTGLRIFVDKEELH